ncbi:hypothetical protein GUJ93_ZPchr0004g38353 [Zizania palustris]|uniref:Uncharacterized protein n=1 Tax=Zizania palustris TaxID=103762 RepID=A0A8J5SJU0_ZIZPA|nr:hypothetical protein GUJ93_ZPchr0004g38353 [Zizania palustris]
MGRADNKILFGNMFEENCSWYSAADNWNCQNAISKSGEPCFQYFECEPPHDRMPLADKVYELYQDFPPLTSLNSIELSPSSWMSIFWYPIGHVPMTTHKDLTTCFLTYHSLSTFEGSTPPDSKVALTLAPFGLATHKTDEDVWTSKDSGDQELVTSLVGATDSWLKKLGIKHHDFSYFLNNNKDIIHYRSITKASTSASTGTDTATA